MMGKYRVFSEGFKHLDDYDNLEDAKDYINSVVCRDVTDKDTIEYLQGEDSNHIARCALTWTPYAYIVEV